MSKVHSQPHAHAAARALYRAEEWLEGLLPAGCNPLSQLGALANGMLLVAVATGVLLLVWYVPSVHQAHDSLLTMEQSPFCAGLVRSLHRYASDACMLLVLLHALRIVLEGRYTGARWLAWITGSIGLGILWLVGWLGYWLVWDQPAQHVALGTAKFVDQLPIFVDSLQRSFVGDAQVNSLLFFLVFFAHMLLPMLLALALWLHVARLARARYLPTARLMGFATAAMVLVSVLVPAAAEPKAAMVEKATGFAIDVFYLLPLWLTDRCSGGVLWLLALVGFGGLCAWPWLARKRPQAAATVELALCNGCTRCSQDCPYLAIAMLPRQDGKRHALQAAVDPSLCVGCGICVGACDTAGISLPWLPTKTERQRLAGSLAASPDPTALLIACTHSGVSDCTQAPAGWRVETVPCIGWVHMRVVELALQRGAREVVLAGCGISSCQFREGGHWTQQRLQGQREPALRSDGSKQPVRVINLPPGSALARQLAGAPAPRLRKLLAGTLLVLGIALVPVASFAAYRTGLSDEPELVFAFKHPGQLVETQRKLSESEKQALPRHMQRDFELVRTRQPVRLRIVVDNRVLVQRTIPPAGLWGDGAAAAVERLPLTPGPHAVSILLGDGADAEVFEHQDQRKVEAVRMRRVTVLFDRHSGFHWL